MDVRVALSTVQEELKCEAGVTVTAREFVCGICALWVYFSERNESQKMQELKP
jgi:hypothetical protein